MLSHRYLNNHKNLMVDLTVFFADRLALFNRKWVPEWVFRSNRYSLDNVSASYFTLCYIFNSSSSFYSRKGAQKFGQKFLKHHHQCLYQTAYKFLCQSRLYFAKNHLNISSMYSFALQDQLSSFHERLA